MFVAFAALARAHFAVVRAEGHEGADFAVWAFCIVLVPRLYSTLLVLVRVWANTACELRGYSYFGIYVIPRLFNYYSVGTVRCCIARGVRDRTGIDVVLWYWAGHWGHCGPFLKSGPHGGGGIHPFRSSRLHPPRLATMCIF